MLENVVSLRLKPAVTTTHGHTVDTDAVKIDDDDTNHKNRASSLIFGHRSHLHGTQGGQPSALSPPRRMHLVGGWSATLHGRSDASCGYGSLAWIHCDALHTDPVQTHCRILLLLAVRATARDIFAFSESVRPLKYILNHS